MFNIDFYETSNEFELNQRNPPKTKSYQILYRALRIQPYKICY